MSNEIVSANIATSITNAATVEDKKKLFSIVNRAGSLNDYIEDSPTHTVHAVYLATTQGIRKGRDGQPDDECINSYIVTADGTAVMSQSAGIADSVQAMISMFGNEVDFELKVIEQGTKRGNIIKKLDFAD